MITAGAFKATVVGAFLGEMSNEKKTPYLGIEFEIPTGESIEYLGWLTDAAKEYTLANLIKCGFKGTRLTDIADDKKSMTDLFDVVENLSIVIEHEEYENSEGEKKTRPKVKFINDGTESNLTKFDHKQAVATFKSLSFDGDLARIRKEGPKKKEKKEKDPTAPKTSQEYSVENDTNFTSDDIPF